MNLVSDALTYPLRGSGKYMLLWGAVLSVIASIAGFAPLFISAYFCATYFTIVETTAVGQSEAPQFPDVSNILEDLLWPLFKVMIVFILCYLPHLAYLITTGNNDAIATFLLVLGLIYFPMAILAVIVLGYLGAMNPMIVIPSIFRAGGFYLLAVIFLGLIYFLQATVAEALGGYFIIGGLVCGAGRA